MAPPRGAIPPAAKPQYEHFDPWNSSSTGHQRAENRLASSTGWRKSRSLKLAHQFRSGGSGGPRLHDQVGAGSLDFDEKLKAVIPKNVRQRAQVSITDMLQSKKPGPNESLKGSPIDNRLEVAPEASNHNGMGQGRSPTRGIFSGLVFFVNGRASPISDHKLKRLLTEEGGRVSIHLGRREVTHVILGRACDGARSGSEGALAASKIQKEVRRVGGSSVKYIGVEWVLECLNARKRLPEAQFGFKFKGQPSVLNFFKKDDSIN